ncbi:short chain dehydrogenase [Thermotomaculum hydrothermale]|uniref:Short chain dehydrogenase n=1 Tax=Thermotomaculum hydrothermale TaxID=981385 RepID=A0A7R6PSQ4_9BACT|nr:SDR family NAD(P)-dependent oxidoreductase [Thermotomaculum hydrothermale]BBB33626.1 short chain dehydrogenase [Thermotomaculum hydrothermale]
MKTILITGVSSGIGRATAKLFLENNWRVVGLDISPSPSDLKDKILFFQCNVVNRGEVLKVFKALRRENIFIDALFSSAGILRMGKFEEIDLKEHIAEIDINFKGVVNCIFIFKPLLKRGSAIVNMSSLSALYGTPELAVYSATKSAVKSLTESLNIEFEKYGVYVCDVIVDYVKTPMVLNAKNIATSVRRLGVTITPEKVANTVFYAVDKGKRVHHYVGLKAKALNFLAKLFPFMSRFLARLLAFK